MRPDSRKGMMGIGALVIFIAIILIAAVAAGVLITTGGSLQQKALLTGTQTEEGIASGIEAVTLVGSDARTETPHEIGDFKILVRLQAGSSGLNFNNTIVTVDTEQGTYTFTYNETVSTDSTSSSTSQYLIYYVLRGNNYQEGYLSRGDNAKIIFQLDPEIKENEFVRIKIIPRLGQYTQIEFTTPDSMTQQSLTLWPS